MHMMMGQCYPQAPYQPTWYLFQAFSKKKKKKKRGLGRESPLLWVPFEVAAFTYHKSNLVFLEVGQVME
jgi:hypothetical protein